MNKTATFLRTWGWLIGAFLILLLVLGNRSGCTKQEENEPLDLFQSAAEDLNSAYRKQLKAERSRDRYFEGLDRFIGAQESEGLWGNDNRRTTSQHPQPSKEERGNTNCCDSAGVTVGNGNQIVTINIGDETSKKKTESTPTTPVKKSTTPTVKKTEKAVEKPCTVINNYYGYDKKESQKTVKEAVQPKVSSSSSSFRKEIQTSEGMRLFEGEKGRVEYEEWLNTVGDFYKEAPYKGGTRVFRGEKGRIEYEEYLNGEESTKYYSSNSESSDTGFRREVKTSEGNRVFTSESEYNAWARKVRGGR